MPAHAIRLPYGTFLPSMSSSRARIGEEWSCGKATVGIGGHSTTSKSWNSACQRARKPPRTRPVFDQAEWVIVKPRRRAAAILKSSGDSACAAASTRSRSSGARSVLKNADSSST